MTNTNGITLSINNNENMPAPNAPAYCRSCGSHTLSNEATSVQK